MFRSRSVCRLLGPIAVVLAAALPTVAQDAPDAPLSDEVWELWDRLHPELAGQGPAIWERAERRAEALAGQRGSAEFLALREFVFDRLVQMEEDRRRFVAGLDGDVPPELQRQRKAALVAFERDAAVVRRLRSKPADELTNEDLRDLVLALAGVVEYSTSARLNALEYRQAELLMTIDELRAERDVLAAGGERSAGSAPPPNRVAGYEEAPDDAYLAQIEVRRIVIDDDGFRDTEYDPNNVSVAGVFKNKLDGPARFRFNVAVVRDPGDPVGWGTVETPLLAAEEVWSFTERVPVTHSAYARGVDMGNVVVRR